jgi:integrase
VDRSRRDGFWRAQEEVQQETFPTKEEAEDRQREIENATASATRVIGRVEREAPFATYAALWVGEARDAVALGDLKARSVADREGTLARYVLPTFATRPVGAITRAEARQFRSALIARGLAPATVKGAFDTFRRVLEIAVDNGVLPSNPAILRRKPGGNRTRHAAGFQHRPLTKTQLGAVVAAAGGTPAPTAEIDALVILFLAYTGVRAGELCGLNVGDLRLTARGRRLSVVRTRKRSGGRWAEDTPKSVKSTRRVPLPGWLAERSGQVVPNVLEGRFRAGWFTYRRGVDRPEKLLTTAQAAEHLGISRGTLARYARDGLLKPTLTLPTGHLRWSLEDLRRQMRELRERDA